MFQVQVRSFMLVGTFGVAIAAGSAAQTSDKEKICSQLQTREPTVGTT